MDMMFQIPTIEKRITGRESILTFKSDLTSEQTQFTVDIARLPPGYSEDLVLDPKSDETEKLLEDMYLITHNGAILTGPQMKQ